jgi:hypothetical protein
MRRMLAVLALLCPAVLAADTIRPDASGLPIFQVFPLIENSSKVMSIDRDHPLLSVEELSDIYLKGDKHRVRIVLTADDSKAFAAILAKFDGVGITVGHDTAMISGYKGFNGSLTFSDPIAADLRQRFHVKPGSNDVDGPPLSPFAAPNQ